MFSNCIFDTLFVGGQVVSLCRLRISKLPVLHLYAAFPKEVFGLMNQWFLPGTHAALDIG
jgi:hypothetical protein